MSEPFDRLKRALMEVKAHQEGKIELPTLRVEIDVPDVRRIRQRLKLSFPSNCEGLGAGETPTGH